MADPQSDETPHLSGTAVAPVANINQGSLDDRLEHTPLHSTVPLSDEGQALESHEVIELQTFSERKAWIEEKIKFLEQMPSVEVFTGLDAVRASAEHVPGLPTPDELRRWIAEHDVIEKETEIFDRGELTKLRQLTKAAAQRNLSPADTDLIELALTTIYELDKLLHLLRDRSENLELLATRLSWEESRIAAWVDRRTILEDLQTFLVTRVRWTPVVYESISRSDDNPDLKRRGSFASLASVASDTSSSSLGLSRGARFKLVESLSQDAAQFAGRVTSLRHGRILAAGKILDRLIDQSRKPVPDELLDEQDKLEELGITEMENLGKADEIYVETMLDKTAAQNMFEEIETAKLHHPTARQSASFVSRADALIRRLASRGNPVSSTSTFPSPEHPVFIDQRNFNQTLAQFLSSEIVTTTTMARKVDDAAKAYRTAFEAVKHVENLTSTAKELIDILSRILVQLQGGCLVSEGNGYSPNLTSATCLEPDQYSAFLDLFPPIAKHFAQTAERSKHILQHSVPAMLDLDHPGIDVEFIHTASSIFRELEMMMNQVQTASEDMTTRYDRLTEARRLDTVLKATMSSLKNTEKGISASIETQRWRRVTGLPSQVHSAVTRSSSPSPTGTSRAECLQELLRIDSRINQEVEAPLRLLVETLEDPLKLYLLRQFSEVRKFLDKIKEQGVLLDSIQRQSATMKAVYEEFSSIQRDIEVLKNRYEFRTRDVLSVQSVNSSISRTDTDLETDLSAIQAQVSHYINRLSDRIPFVSQDTRSFPSRDGRLLKNNQSAPSNPNMDLFAVDNAVRADSNSFAMTLSTLLEELNQNHTQLHLAYIAKEVDVILVPTAAHIDRLTEDLVTMKTSLSDMTSRSDGINVPLLTLRQDVERVLQHDNPHVERSFSQIRDLLHKMSAVYETKDSSAHKALHVSRFKSLENIADLHKAWEKDVWAFLDEISEIGKTLQVERVCAETEQIGRLRAKEKTEESQAESLRKQAEHEKAMVQMEQVLPATEDGERLMEERCLQSEEDQRAVASMGSSGNLDNEEESRRLQIDRLNEGTLDEVGQNGMTEEAESLQEERRMTGGKLESNKRCVAGQSRPHEGKYIESENNPEVAEGIGSVPYQQVQQRLSTRAVNESIHRLDGKADDQSSFEVIVGLDSLERNGVPADYHPIKQPAANDALQVVSEEDYFPSDQDFVDDSVQCLSQMTHGNPSSKPSGQASWPHMAQGQTPDVEIKVQLGDNKKPASYQTKPGERQIEELHQCHSLHSPKLHRSPESNHPAKGSTSSSTSYLQKTRFLFEEDVFGLPITAEGNSYKRKEMHDLQAQILVFRRRLRSMNINDITRAKMSTRLPDMDQSKKVAREFLAISSGVSLLPLSASDPSVDVELQSLRTEIEGSVDLVKRVEQLAHLAEDISKSDVALSDLLEHIDSYPASPTAILSSSYTAVLGDTPDEKLSARLAFTRGVIETMITNFAGVSTDSRAISEQTRILQTFHELEDMVHDIKSDRKSRPTSAISFKLSSGRNSNASNTPTHASRKTGAYPNLTTPSASPHQRLLLTRHPTPRRAVSGGTAECQSRPVSQLSSVSSNRAVSGPFRASVYSSTFASRQRTSSLSNSHCSPTTIHVHSRAQTAQQSRVASPTGSDASPCPRSVRNSHTRSSTSLSAASWARAPKNSPSSIVHSMSTTPKDQSAMPRKTYVADPKNKLDVAVGDVVNKLPVRINVEGVADTWKDQSGKYWIGNQDPKLCFCRILRSQTVMVRVGGGWSELSKYISLEFVQYHD
ncbi:hypothetical protein C0993_010028 [Termitomyces sp. T159_Od127]|nr:hypothetical protein C0993_010028 [Termitomyces sp. T159_Od127]